MKKGLCGQTLGIVFISSVYLAPSFPTQVMWRPNATWRFPRMCVPSLHTSTTLPRGTHLLSRVATSPNSPQNLPIDPTATSSFAHHDGRKARDTLTAIVISTSIVTDSHSLTLTLTHNHTLTAQLPKGHTSSKLEGKDQNGEPTFCVAITLVHK